MRSNGDPPLLARVRVWLPPRRSRGPAPAYDRDQIADAAIEIADEEGLEAVTMRAVAARLGTGAMSLYRYVERKEALFELMGDRMLGRQDWPPLTGDWRQDLRDLAGGQRCALLDHPWLLRVWSGGPALGPNMLAGFERAMSIVDGLGLNIDEMFETVTLLHTWVNGYVRTELDELAYFGDASREEVQRAMGPYVELIVESGRYPYFTRVITEARTPHIDSQARFERALERVLAGIEATLPKRE
ncbi:transcriptional regulator [Saccharomonospora marina XMU15]|uniref:Transcriptional regulator n=1 Tax=Saccharomonospora marina XMU15 TaxID=882083 RepID=H5XAL0_9PSEU|nr:transcriptional regulator [Saccharomonospora marina XMU15]